MRCSQADLLFNTAPGTQRPILRMADGRFVIEDRWWMYKEAGSTASARPTPNARLDKISGRYWGRLVKTGRIVVPANGWYEWTGEKPNKQPWHTHRADSELLYMDALTAWGPEGEDRNVTGFAIITDDAEGGMIDIHDRRPVVFTASDAATWLDPELSGEAAAELARSVALGPERFAWYQVAKAVGNSRNQGPELAVPLAPGLFD